MIPFHFIYTALQPLTILGGEFFISPLKEGTPLSFSFEINSSRVLFGTALAQNKWSTTETRELVPVLLVVINQFGTHRRKIFLGFLYPCHDKTIGSRTSPIQPSIAGSMLSHVFTMNGTKILLQVQCLDGTQRW